MGTSLRRRGQGDIRVDLFQAEQAGQPRTFVGRSWVAKVHHGAVNTGHISRPNEEVFLEPVYVFQGGAFWQAAERTRLVFQVPSDALLAHFIATSRRTLLAEINSQVTHVLARVFSAGSLASATVISLSLGACQLARAVQHVDTAARSFLFAIITVPPILAPERRLIAEKPEDLLEPADKWPNSWSVAVRSSECVPPHRSQTPMFTYFEDSFRDRPSVWRFRLFSEWAACSLIDESHTLALEQRSWDAVALLPR